MQSPERPSIYTSTGQKMTFSRIPPEIIAAHFLTSCHGELTALKPGNVHIFANGHRMEVSQFEAAAQAAAPIIADPNLTVGQRILKSVRASFDASGCNTNLGIILLCAPLAHAAGTPSAAMDLRQRLRDILFSMNVQDAIDAFDAIRHANPAGLGEAADADVYEPPKITLRDAMACAADKDRIANAYVNDFADIFDFGIPTLESAKKLAKLENCDEAFAITTLHMSYLAKFPDSHIRRKHGNETALEVQNEALRRTQLWSPLTRPDTFDSLIEFDTWLKHRELNPGTTADMVVATLFADLLSKSLLNRFKISAYAHEK